MFLEPGGLVAQHSWWPRQETFLISGCWPGYWSPGLEAWFQKRLTALEDESPSGTLTIFNGNLWGSKLRWNEKELRVILGHQTELLHLFLTKLEKVAK